MVKGRDYWVVKIDALGNKLWDKRFGVAGDDWSNRVITTSDGGILLVGSSSSGTGGDKSEQSRGNTDFWILKISKREYLEEKSHSRIND